MSVTPEVPGTPLEQLQEDFKKAVKILDEEDVSVADASGVELPEDGGIQEIISDVTAKDPQEQAQRTQSQEAPEAIAKDLAYLSPEERMRYLNVLETNPSQAALIRAIGRELRQRAERRDSIEQRQQEVGRGVAVDEVTLTPDVGASRETQDEVMIRLHQENMERINAVVEELPGDQRLAFLEQQLEIAGSDEERQAIQERIQAEQEAASTVQEQATETEAEQLIQFDPEEEILYEEIIRGNGEVGPPIAPIETVAGDGEPPGPPRPPVAPIPGDEGEGQTPKTELGLEEINRQIKEVVRYYGDFHEFSEDYRRSDAGEARLRFLQDRFKALIRKRLERARKIRILDDELRQLSSSLRTQPAELKEKFEKLLILLKLPKGELHQQLYQEDRSLSTTELYSRLNQVRTRKNERFPVIDQTSEVINQQIGQIYSEIEQRSTNPEESELVRELMLRAQELARQRNALEVEKQLIDRERNTYRYILAERVLVGNRNLGAFKRYWDKREERYSLKEEIERAGSDGTGEAKAFNPEMSFDEALSRYQISVNTERAEEAKVVIEEYFREGRRRGYFERFQEAISEVLKPYIDKALSEGRRFVLTPEICQKVIERLKQLKAEGSSHINNFVSRGREGGIRSTHQDLNYEKFGNAVELWINRAENYFSQIRDESFEFKPIKAFDGEYTGSVERTFWRTTYAGYYEVLATTAEEFQIALEDFYVYLTSGAVERNPTRLFQELQYFEKAFTPKAREMGFEDTTAVKSWRIQLKSRLGFWGADYFAALANTPYYKEVLKLTFDGLDGMDVMKESIMAMDGKVGLAIRLMDRKRRYDPIHRYYGENGGLALEDNSSGDYEYVMRQGSLDDLAEEVMLHDLSEQVAADQSEWAERRDKSKEENLADLVHFQTTDRFVGHFKRNTVLESIRDKLRSNPKDVSVEEREMYNRAFKRAKDAVQFAHLVYSGLGERTRKAGPSFIVEIYRRNERGRIIDEDGNEVNKRGELVDAEGKVIKKKDFIERVRDQLARGEKVREFTRELYKNADKSPKGDNDSVYSKPVVERVDYVSKDLSIKFLQFAENLARIMAVQQNEKAKEENIRRQDSGEALLPILNAVDIARKAQQFRRMAKMEIATRGILARLLDENGKEIVFRKSVRFQHSQRDGIDLAAFQTEGIDLVNLEDVLTIDRGGELPEGYTKVGFDAATTHTLSQWNAQTYLALQHEIRSQLLREENFKAAERIRRGEKLPEEEDVLASMLLQIDPTLTRLPRGGIILPGGSTQNEKYNIRLIQHAVNGSFQNHWRITRELDRQFTDLDPNEGKNTGRQRVYYGVPNERFSIKELMWNSNKVDREDDRFARRAYTLISESPVHFSSLPDMMGFDISGMMGIFERSLEVDKEFLREVTDSNVIGGWIELIDQAYQVYVRFARGEVVDLKRNEIRTALLMKPFNDLDDAERTLPEIIKAVTNPANEISVYQAFRKLLGRLEDTLKAIEIQDNSRGSKGALWLELYDIHFDSSGKVEVLEYDGQTGKPKTKEKGDPKWVDLTSKELKNTGSGAQSAYIFYREFVKYADTLARLEHYSSQAPFISMMRLPFPTRLYGVEGGFKNFWDYFASKAIRTFPES